MSLPPNTCPRCLRATDYTLEDGVTRSCWCGHLRVTPVGPGVLTMKSGEKVETINGTATVIPTNVVVGMLDGVDDRGDVERLLAVLREPDPEPVRVKVKVAGPAYLAQGKRLYLVCDSGFTATCTACGPIDTWDSRFADVVADEAARYHLEHEHGVGR